MPKLIVVVGATGNQGGSVVRTFASLPGWRVRGITRNPTSPSAQALQAAVPNIELVAASLDSRASLVAAFTGAHAIFTVTDFWQFIRDAATIRAAAARGISVNEAAFDAEIQQGKSLVDAAAEVAAAPESVLERLVMSTLSDSRVRSGGKYTWNYHFEGKAKITAYLNERAREEGGAYEALRARTSWLQVGFYLDNWRSKSLFTPHKQPDGSFLIRSCGVPTGAAQHAFPFVHPPTDTGPFTEALVLRAPPNTTLLGTSQLMQAKDYAALWGRLVGVDCRWEAVTMDFIQQQVPGPTGIEISESSAYVAELGWDGGEGAKLPEEVGVDLTQLTTPEQYIRETDWSSLL